MGQEIQADEETNTFMSLSCLLKGHLFLEVTDCFLPLST